MISSLHAALDLTRRFWCWIFDFPSQSFDQFLLTKEIYMMAKQLKFVPSLLVLPLFLGCSFGSQAAELVFGQIAPFTNLFSATCAKGLAAGATSCFEAVNAGGGVYGNTFKLVNKNDDIKPARMMELTDQLIEDRSILGLMSFLNTGGINEIIKSKKLIDAQIALIGPMQGDQSVISAENIFPLRSGYADEVYTLMKEAKGSNKDTVAIVNIELTFRPAMAELAKQRAKELGLNVVFHAVINSSVEKMPASVAAAAQAITTIKPKAILLLVPGKAASEFIKAVRTVAGGSAQIYGLSVLDHAEVVKAVGLENARGIILSQAIPYPFSPTSPVVGEYQRAMKIYAPSEPLSFASLEGCLGAKIAVEAVRRAGPAPTRKRLLNSLQSMGEYNLGGVYVKYAPEKKRGWGGMDLSIINSSGQLQK